MSLVSSLKVIRDQVDQATTLSGRKSGEVTIIAVSKTHSVERIKEAHGLGQTDFGENYVQEVVPKLKELHSLSLKWHFIGHLQTNKVKNISDRMDLIHTVDSYKLALEISRRSTKTQNILIEVNLAKEATKAGVFSEKLPDLLDQIQTLPQLQLCGLMFMAPLNLSPNEQKSYFGQARIFRDRMESRLSPPHSLRELSMGTTGDFFSAILEGSTMVRIGTAIFGERGK